MACFPEKIIEINGMKFVDVTNQTVSGRIYSYAEAYAKSQGREVCCGFFEPQKNNEAGENRPTNRKQKRAKKTK